MSATRHYNTAVLPEGSDRAELFDLVDEAAELVHLIDMATWEGDTGNAEADIRAVHAGAKHASALLTLAVQMMLTSGKPPSEMVGERRVPRGG